MPSYASLLDALRGVHWPARRAVAGGMTGAHHSRRRGVSAEFSEYRPYRQGDDPRRIDWKLLARSDRAYIRLADDRALFPTMLVVDASASMAFPAPALEKWMTARRLAVGLAAVAHADGDPVGLAVPARAGTRRLAPRTRRGVVAEIARTLDDVAPAGDMPLAPAIATMPSDGRVAVISDFLGDAEDTLRAARQLVAAGGEVHAVHVVAREELEPDALDVLAVDPEDAAIRRPLTADTREVYARTFADWREGLAREWRAAGALYTVVATTEPVERAVRRIVAAGGTTDARAALAQ